MTAQNETAICRPLSLRWSGSEANRGQKIIRQPWQARIYWRPGAGAPGKIAIRQDRHA